MLEKNEKEFFELGDVKKFFFFVVDSFLYKKIIILHTLSTNKQQSPSY
jgi:hypothetical protein